MMRGYPGSNRCRSNPCPTRNGKVLAGVDDCGAWPSSTAAVAAADAESLGVVAVVVFNLVDGSGGRRKKILLKSGLLGELDLAENEEEEEEA